MGKKRGNAGSVLTAARPFPTRDLEQITSEMIAWAETGYSRNPMDLPAVFASVRLIASTINQLPVDVENGELPWWLRYPRATGAALDLGDLVQFIVTSMALNGAAYLRCVHHGESWRIDALHPRSVRVQVSTEGIVERAFFVGAEQWDEVPTPRPANQGGQKITDGQTYILHIPYLVTPAHPEGTAPTIDNLQSILGYLSVERQASTLLDNGTYSGGRLESEQDITDDTAIRYQKTWVTNRKIGNLPVLGAGLKYINDLVDPSDAQWLESRQYNGQQIAMMYGIPPDYLGMTMTGGNSSLSYQNSQDNDQRFRRNALAAFTQQISNALSMLLPPGRGEDENQRLVFDYTRWEGEGAKQPEPAAAVDDQGQPGRDPNAGGDSGSLEQPDHLRRDAGIVRAGSVRPEGSDRETPAVESPEGRTDRAHHDSDGLPGGTADFSDHPTNDTGQGRDDAPQRGLYQRALSWLRPGTDQTQQRGGGVHDSPPPRTITYPVTGIPVGDSDSD